MPKSKTWCFTVNNYTDEEESNIHGLVEGGVAGYLVCGREKGDQGVPHLQGYVEFKVRKSLTTVKKLAGFERAHLEVRRGSSGEAAEYCKKDGDFHECGVISTTRQGKRTDLDDAISAIKEGISLRELWGTHSKVMVRYSKGLTELRNRVKPVQLLRAFELSSFSFALDFDPGFSHVVVGPSGCGKTSYARSRYPRALMATHIDDLLSYDRDEHEAIIFDDMSFLHLPRTAQIHLVDWDDDRSIHCRYACAHIPRETLKIFTTNVAHIFDMCDAAIARRVKVHRVE